MAEVMAQRYRQLTAALFVFLVVHAVAMVVMPVLVAPGLDTQADVTTRMAYVAAHPWRWRLGWLPWQACAVSDVLLAIALVRWRSSAWNWLGLAFTALAVIPDQWGEWLMTTELIELAQSGSSAAYLELEARTLLFTGACGNTTYVLMTLCWMLAIAKAAPTKSRPQLWIGAISLLGFTGSGWFCYQATRDPSSYPGYGLAGLFAGVGFVLLLVWTCAAAIAIAEDEPLQHASHDLVWPTGSRGGGLAAILAHPGLRDLFRFLPFVALRSEVTDVVYLNWMVPIEKVRSWLPKPLEPHTFGDYTVLSILTYRHGSFGPSLMGPLRRVLASPLQSNWRLYLEPVDGRQDAVYFFKTVLSSAPLVVASRLLADGLPAHYAATFVHKHGDAIVTEVRSAGGSAPDLKSTVSLQDCEALPGPFAEHFASWNEAVTYLVEQSRAVVPVHRRGRMIESRIDIPIAVGDVVPASATVKSTFLAEVIGDAEVFAFVVPAVDFRALGEGTLP